jgi:sister-chromatid-cohesion protein PDS5
MQTWPVKVGMPVGLFAALPSHEIAQEIAEKNYMPEDMDDLLEELVRTSGKKIKVNCIPRRFTQWLTLQF